MIHKLQGETGMWKEDGLQRREEEQRLNHGAENI